MFTIKIVHKIQDSTILMFIIRRNHIIRVIIIGGVIIIREPIFNDAPFRYADNSKGRVYHLVKSIVQEHTQMERIMVVIRFNTPMRQ